MRVRKSPRGRKRPCPALTVLGMVAEKAAELVKFGCELSDGAENAVHRARTPGTGGSDWVSRQRRGDCSASC